MEKFEKEGRKFWESFGKSTELLPRQYFDFISEEKYQELLDKYNLQDKKVIDLGAGYPPFLKKSPEKQLTPLASEVQEILEKKGAKIIPIDVAPEPLKHQKQLGRESILGDAFKLPLKNDSIDGGCVILNLFNSSFKNSERKEIFIDKEETKRILREVHRVLQEDSFVIVSNYGYITATIDGLVKVMGLEKEEIIAPEDIKKIAEEEGFKRTKEIPLDQERIDLAKKLIPESFPEPLRERITFSLEAPGALLLEK